jgi:hypothetical protein
MNAAAECLQWSKDKGRTFVEKKGVQTMALTGLAAARWMRRVVLIAPALICSPCTGQPIITAVPNQVVDLRTLLRAHTLRQDFSFGGIAQSNGRWAVYANFPNTKTSMIVTGRDDGPPQFSDFIEGLGDRIAMDPSGEIYLRMQYTQHIPGGGDIEIWNSALELIGRQRYKNASLEPISSQVGVFWADGLPVKSIFRLGVGFVQSAGALADALEQPFDPSTPDYGTVVALADGTVSSRWIRVKEVAEEVAVFENNGLLLTKNNMNLDAAYTAFGYSIPQHYPAVEAVRVAWIAVSAKGELYVRLGSVPFGKPTPIAVIDPLSGKLLRVVALVLPRSAERVGQYNPQGFIDDTQRAMGDRLAVLDAEVGLLAVYLNY